MGKKTITGLIHSYGQTSKYGLFEYFVDTYFNGQKKQLKEILSEIDNVGEREQLVDYLELYGHNEITIWIAKQSN